MWKMISHGAPNGRNGTAPFVHAFAPVIKEATPGVAGKVITGLVARYETNAVTHLCVAGNTSTIAGGWGASFRPIAEVMSTTAHGKLSIIWIRGKASRAKEDD